MLLTRQQFIDHFNSISDKLGDNDSILWTQENSNNVVNEWFICVKPIPTDSAYVMWCNKNLKNYPLCYSSNNITQEEWWGFKNREDIFIWMLRYG